ncbi:DUF5998 family protein [Saxibacter everestensis]|uniref:DUF5998 family protein n=1 Tax=Saxibacter everestensis TaxID=2909229 RepID=A0ABY8QP53_9MICO|nr:DUF5998 family protein [Brevibacteriaceae bacterium ZFBP1038]
MSQPSATGKQPAQSVVPEEVLEDLQRAGYYPQLAAHVFGATLFGEPVRSHLVHVETHFDLEEVHRHITVLMLTPTRLLLGHIDDDPGGPGQGAFAQATTEDIPLARIRSVLIGHVFNNPEQFRPGQDPREVTVTLSWGGVSRVEMRPEDCADPQCDADHGYAGIIGGEDLALRVSSQAEGAQAVSRTLTFATELRHAAHIARTTQH